MSDYMKNYDDDIKLINELNNDNNKTVNRWKSKIVWSSSFALILIILGSLGLYEKLGITEDKLKTVVDSILSLLVVLGILNNPTTTEKF